jgi:hypothetical protein
MGVGRHLGTLALALAVLAAAAPLAADACGGAARCPMMRMARAIGHGACGGELQLLPETSCCRPAPEPATAPAAAGVAAPALAAPALAAALVPASAVALALPAPVAAVAERSRAEQRHALGVFLLDSVFRI